MNFLSCLKLQSSFFCCQLRTLGIILGWLGVVYKTIFAVIFIVLLTQTAEYDPNLYDVVFSICLTYSLMSLIANGLLIYGIYKNKSTLLLPYLSLETIEIICMILAYAFLIYFFSLEGQFVLEWFVPVGLIVIVLHIYMWLCLVNLYIELDEFSVDH